MSTTEPTAIVVRFAATDHADAQSILEAFNHVCGDRNAEAWMCIRDSLDALNVTLTGLGWPPPPDTLEYAPDGAP